MVRDAGLLRERQIECLEGANISYANQGGGEMT